MPQNPTLLICAIITITLALVFYTTGVWSEKIQGQLKRWHLLLFWTGFVFDTTGTTLMGKLAGDILKLNFHSVTGALAILLMLIHALWGTVVLARNRESERISFHKFSLIVWLIWLAPYLSGMIYGMAG